MYDKIHYKLKKKKKKNRSNWQKSTMKFQNRNPLEDCAVGPFPPSEP